MQKYLKAIKDHVQHPEYRDSDIAEHLTTIFTESCVGWPKVMVELGVRTGESTFALAFAAEQCDAKLISVDNEYCSNACGKIEPEWYFVQADSVQFSGEFLRWCQSKIPNRVIDDKHPVEVLFIDTCHIYEMTRREVEAWFPLLYERSVVIMHDTNKRLRPDRGVIRVLENLFCEGFCETTPFVKYVESKKYGGFVFSHWPNCNGLAVLRRV